MSRELPGNDAPGWVVDSGCELRVGGAWQIAFGASPRVLDAPGVTHVRYRVVS